MRLRRALSRGRPVVHPATAVLVQFSGAARASSTLHLPKYKRPLGVEDRLLHCPLAMLAAAADYILPASATRAERRFRLRVVARHHAHVRLPAQLAVDALALVEHRLRPRLLPPPALAWCLRLLLLPGRPARAACLGGAVAARRRRAAASRCAQRHAREERTERLLPTRHPSSRACDAVARARPRAPRAAAAPLSKKGKLIVNSGGVDREVAAHLLFCSRRWDPAGAQCTPMDH